MRPCDLYDVVNLYRHTDSRPTSTVILDVLREKCDYKTIPTPTFASIEPHRQAPEAMWSDSASDTAQTATKRHRQKLSEVKIWKVAALPQKSESPMRKVP